jgi:hypothetical protein
MPHELHQITLKKAFTWTQMLQTGQIFRKEVRYELFSSKSWPYLYQDQIVKQLPIKGLVGQEMALDDYLQYIKQEALAAPRRTSVRGSRKVRQPPLWGEGA